MNIIKFAQELNKKIVYCLIDHTHEYTVNWTKELVKNQADYTISNIYSKNYDVYQSQSEDQVLKHVANLEYKYAVVFSTGTEFINGQNFFDAINALTLEEFFIAGHVLDRGDAYYELHHQCYVVNLSKYKEFGYPLVGQFAPGVSHQQLIPIRSSLNYHDEYTPTWVSPGETYYTYNHCCHGWNILSAAWQRNQRVLVFDENIRTSKKYYYPENQNEFNKHISWAYQRQYYCAEEHVHSATTDTLHKPTGNICQVLTPANVPIWVDIIDAVNPVTVIVFDYNQKALDYWQSNMPTISNVTYKFIKLDIINQFVDLNTILDTSIKETFINLSNIFAYEGTMFFASLEYRLAKENLLLTHIKESLPTATIYFSMRAAIGFTNTPATLIGSNNNLIAINELTRPTWHTTDWL